MSKRCTLCQKELTSGQIICLECATELKAEPTLDECIKEWEERGWKVDFKYPKGIDLVKSKLFRISIYFTDKTYFSDTPLTLKEHQLLTKLFKALGWFDE